MSGARIRIHVDDCGRLHLRWWADDSMLWRDILASFKARFPSHHDRSYAESTKTWSVPRCHYGRLAAWVDRWFDEQDQQWTDEEPAGRAYGRRPDGEDRDGATRAGCSTLAAASSRSRRGSCQHRGLECGHRGDSPVSKGVAMTEEERFWSKVRRRLSHIWAPRWAWCLQTDHKTRIRGP